MNTSGRNKELTMCSRDILHRPWGIILIQSTKIRWYVLETIRQGRLVLLSQAKSLKTTQARSSSSNPLRLDCSCDGQAGGWTGQPVAAQGLYSLKLKTRGTTVGTKRLEQCRQNLQFLKFCKACYRRDINPLPDCYGYSHRKF